MATNLNERFPGPWDTSNDKPTSPRGSRVWDTRNQLYVLPSSRLPSCWQDDDRMSFLFAPFYPRDVNPLGYDSKMEFWTELLQVWCAECGRATFSIALLEKAFRRKNARPACLQTVVEELVRKKDIMTEEQFMSWDRTESWTSWAVKAVVKKPAAWTFTKLKEALISVDPAQIKYVSIAGLKAVGERIMETLEAENRPSVMSFGEFKELVGDEAEHVLRLLKNNQNASEVVFGNERYINIGKGNLTEVDIAKIKLNKELVSLRNLIDDYEESMLRLVDEARSHLQSGKKEAARRCLKEKKTLEKQVVEKSKIADNLEVLLNSLRSTETNAEILNTYKLGLNALKIAQSSVNGDAVADTMFDLEEAIERTHDVTNALNLPGDVDDDELESELKSILGSPESSPSPIPNLPDVPISDPSPHSQPAILIRKNPVPTMER